jgi:ubiquinone/menaquinone biosynthesis C-methylase UbiE
MHEINFDLVPRANTQKDVNKTVLGILEQRKLLNSSTKILDNPCGQGEWAEFLNSSVGIREIVGIDYSAPIDRASQVRYYKMDSSLPFAEKISGQKFDVVTCISGIMAFDNFSQYLSECRKLLSPGGVLVITNDNLWTLRDRLSFFFFGRFKRFKLAFNRPEGNWNIVPIQTLLRALEKQNFKIEDVCYTSIYFEDWLMLPFALILYVPQFLYLLLSKSDQPMSERFRTYPWRAMIARHYVVTAAMTART